MAWEYEIALSATVNQNTPENRTTLATIFANYSGETIANERLMFDKAHRLYHQRRRRPAIICLENAVVR